MATFTSNTANIIGADLIDYATGLPIESGTVQHYLRALTGDNALKYWQASDDTWQETKSSAGQGTHQGEGHWEVSVVAAAWETGVKYQRWAEVDSGRQLTVREDVIEDTTVVHWSVNIEVTAWQS